MSGLRHDRAIEIAEDYRPADGEEWPVTTLITGDKLRAATNDGGFIKNGVADSVEGAKYDFRMSQVVLKASYGNPVDIKALTEEQRAKMRVDPGEVVFVKTIENLLLPSNITALLSPKRKLSHLGIIVLGGFCVDPLYSGPLFIGLYNFSSTPFPLIPGKKIIAAIFTRLDGDELTNFPIPEAMAEEGFPDELVTLIRNYKPIEIRSLSESVSDLQAKLNSLTEEVRDDRSWKHEFKESLDRQSNVIDRILKGLEDETIKREKEDDSIKNKLDRMSGLFTAGRTIMAIILIIITAIVTVYVEKNYSTWVGQIKSESPATPNEERQRLKIFQPHPFHLQRFQTGQKERHGKRPPRQLAGDGCLGLLQPALVQSFGQFLVAYPGPL
jgi:deoxycytidine triphosphate deaminase